jgi:hypothetical protein
MKLLLYCQLLTPGRLKNRHFGLAKTLGSDGLKWFHISNIELFKILKSRGALAQAQIRFLESLEYK